jgi:PAS domain S-box-containing protein
MTAHIAHHLKLQSRRINKDMAQKEPALLVTEHQTSRVLEMDLQNFPETLVQNISDAIVVSDADGVIQFWNSGATRLFGFSATEAIGQSLDIIIPTNLRKRHWDGYSETMKTGKTKYGAGDLLSVPAIRKDGQRISTQFSILGLSDDSGKLIGVAAVMRDVTEEFEERKNLKIALAECRKARQDQTSKP